MATFKSGDKVEVMCEPDNWYRCVIKSIEDGVPFIICDDDPDGLAIPIYDPDMLRPATPPGWQEKQYTEVSNK